MYPIGQVSQSNGCRTGWQVPSVTGDKSFNPDQTRALPMLWMRGPYQAIAASWDPQPAAKPYSLLPMHKMQVNLLDGRAPCSEDVQNHVVIIVTSCRIDMDGCFMVNLS